MLQLPIHRDTWGSGVQQQLNWWLPIYPVQEGRTLQLFPAHFAVPVENTSATWNVKEFVKWRDAAAARQISEAAMKQRAISRAPTPQSPRFCVAG